MAVRLGLDAKLYLNTGSTATPTWSEITNARDVTLNLEKGEADVTTRGNNGWRAMVGTLKDASIEWEMVWDTDDANFTAIKNAFLNNDSVDLAAMDGDITDATSQGLRAVCSVTNFTRNEPLEEALTVNVSVRPTYSPDTPPAWITGTPPGP